MLKYIINSIRKIIGTQQIYNELQAIQNKNQKQMLLLSNAISVLMMDKKIVEESITYVKTKKIISLLEPLKIQNSNFIRVGKKNDGGYVMLNNDLFKNSNIAYSFGISNDTSWDETIAKYGKHIFMYDHTIDNLPNHHSNFHFFKIGLTGTKTASNLKTIEELISINNHQNENNLLMKMDIEDCEWDVFKAVKSETLNQFSQIAIEFHNLSPYVDNDKYDLIIDVLNKINLTHQSVHIHANSDISVPHMMLNLVLPELLEVTFVRKIDMNDLFEENNQIYPSALDESTFYSYPDLFIGKFSSKN